MKGFKGFQKGHPSYSKKGYFIAEYIKKHKKHGR